MKIKAIGLALSLLFTPVAMPENAQAGIITQASRYVGLNESSNRKSLRRLLGVNPSSTAWCGAFVAAMVRSHGKQPPAGYKMAKSWIRYGRSVSLKSARPGDIVVFRFKRSYHVAILIEVRRGVIKAIGGNQSNTVRISNFDPGNVVAVRR